MNLEKKLHPIQSSPQRHADFLTRVLITIEMPPSPEMACQQNL